MNEDFVTFEMAKRLKEKGFPQRPDYFNYSSYYAWDGLRKIHSLSNASVWFDPNIDRENIYFAPTISQVLKWLREEKGISVEPCATPYNCWYYMIKCNGEIKATYTDNKYKTYEAAALAGIECYLDNFI